MLDYFTCGVLDDSLVTVTGFTFGMVVNWIVIFRQKKQKTTEAQFLDTRFSLDLCRMNETIVSFKET